MIQCKILYYMTDVIDENTKKDPHILVEHPCGQQNIEQETSTIDNKKTKRAPTFL